MRGKGARSERQNLFHCFVINWKVYPHGKTFFPKQGRSMDRGASKDSFLSPPCPVPTHALRVYMCTSYILLEPQAVFFLYQKNTPGLIPSKKKKRGRASLRQMIFSSFIGQSPSLETLNKNRQEKKGPSRRSSQEWNVHNTSCGFQANTHVSGEAHTLHSYARAPPQEIIRSS